MSRLPREDVTEMGVVLLMIACVVVLALLLSRLFGGW